jgi:guanylate kinase
MRKLLESRGFKYAVSYTTRPPRPGEVEGVDYYFITKERCQRMKDDGLFYGTSLAQFYSDDVFIMTPSGLEHLDPEDRESSLVMFFDIEESIRRERLEARVMPGHSVEARLQADRELFDGFTNYDVRISDPKF